ncbi:hypothetical protein ACFSLT_18305 [Novosphingobium resinovorum]
MFIHRQRMETRTMLAIKANIRIGSRVAEATLANASSRGVLALVDAPPARGVAVELVVGDQVIKGKSAGARMTAAALRSRKPSTSPN